MNHSPASQRPALKHWMIAIVVLAAVTILAAAPEAEARSVYGTNYNDTLWGTRSNDLILGYGGHDELIGSWGDDTLAGHAGNDRLYGSPGNDVLNGSYGNDVLVSGYDNVRDVLHCGPGVDTVYVRAYDVYDGCEWIYRP